LLKKHYLCNYMQDNRIHEQSHVHGAQRQAMPEELKKGA